MENNSKILMELGVDVTGVVSRLGGNELLYLNICKKFLKDQNYHLLKLAIHEKDFINAKIHLHTLKGVAANLGFNRLELQCKILLEKIEANEFSFLQQNFVNLSVEYSRIISVLKEEQSIYNSDESFHNTLLT